MRSSQGLEALGKSFVARLKEKAPLSNLFIIYGVLSIYSSLPKASFSSNWHHMCSPKRRRTHFSYKTAWAGQKKHAKSQNDGQNLQAVTRGLTKSPPIPSESRLGDQPSAYVPQVCHPIPLFDVSGWSGRGYPLQNHQKIKRIPPIPCRTHPKDYHLEKKRGRLP